MSIAGVLFDFSGTLFRLETPFDGLPGDDGAPVNARERAEIMRRLTAPVGLARGLPDELRDAWERRDLDPELHREVYLVVLRNSGLRRPGSAELLYERMLEPANWHPYPDTVPALRGLADAGIPVAVVSNIAWDIRPVFELHGIADCVSEFVLSYAVGAIKPDPAIFRTACERLGLPGERTLMIGDSKEADGGAAQVGSAVAIVEPLPVDERPDALLGILAEHGLG